MGVPVTDEVRVIARSKGNGDAMMRVNLRGCQGGKKEEGEGRGAVVSHTLTFLLLKTPNSKTRNPEPNGTLLVVKLLNRNPLLRPVPSRSVLFPPT